MSVRSCKYPTSLFLLMLLILLLCACGQKDSAADPIDSNKDLTEEEMEEDMIKDSDYIPAKVIGPDIEPTFETRLATAVQAYDNVCYVYEEMQELAKAENAPKKGKKAAAKLEKKYGDRIAELADTDLSQLTSEELLSVSIECTDIISAIRDVKAELDTN